ncbi:TfdA family taurine catabolism dioxygenase TauD [Stella humosa]|uniref:TfdA family taurine catabolism dioxygenase TauD n=1 Tax=Stella humosa TaxID=94 RepID=A0A3N1KQP3_9PROT|nr:TauD/TfdA family dioxygenase [Stella humosa]ROP81109.1 TfdA family taurine catabolism dioxygenase TauD [Stella humosa]BBK32454.1 hypothetical protein STHU_30880 [Stella humosa]
MTQAMMPVEGPAVWKGSEIDFRQEGLHVLTAAEIEEIDRALVHLKGLGELDLPDITPETFPLPAFSAYLSDLRTTLRRGRGFVMLRGLPRERYSADDMARIYFGIGAHIGGAMAQSHRGELLGSVINVSDFEEAARGYRAGGGLGFHSDSSDVIGLLCLRSARSGGASRIASAAAIHNAILRDRPDLARILYRGFRLRRADLDARHGNGVVFSAHVLPVFTVRDGEFSSYFRSAGVDRAVKAGDMTVTALEREALDAVNRLASSPEYYLDMNFEDGDIQFINNRLLIHARTDYDDHVAVERRRHLLRLWLRVADWPAMPSEQVFHTAEDYGLWRARRTARAEFPSVFLAEMAAKQAAAGRAA